MRLGKFFYQKPTNFIMEHFILFAVVLTAIAFLSLVFGKPKSQVLVKAESPADVTLSKNEFNVIQPLPPNHQISDHFNRIKSSSRPKGLQVFPHQVQEVSGLIEHKPVV